jgi:Ubiquitin carboxyl-terminal hydrolase
MLILIITIDRSFGWEGTEVFQQQDVQELTRVLFDALEECFRGTEVENIIDQLYAGELIDYLRCMDVDYQSERVDKFLDFALAILPFGSTEALGSLSECIETYLRPEILDGENKYYAESVGRKVDAIKGLKFSKLPHIMTVQLKRFVYDFTGMQKKVNDRVTFPMLLDMNTYVVRKSSAQNDSSAQNVSTDAVPEGTVELEEGEFELFLKEQIAILRKEQKSRGENDEEDCGKVVGNQDSTESSNGNTTSSSKSTSRNGIESSFSSPDNAPSVFVPAEGVTLVPQEGDYKGFPAGTHATAAVAVPLLDDVRYSSITSTAVTHSAENEVRATPYSAHTLCPLFSDIDSDIDIDVDSNPRSHGGGIGTYPYIASTVNPYSAVTGTSIQEGNSKSTSGIDEKAKAHMGVEYHLMPGTAEIDKLLEKRGEWVYELYAVLNHSGAISGGHYYAYIKNLETKKWYNFNDSNVSEISEEKVFEAWGGKSKYEGVFVLSFYCP